MIDRREHKRILAEHGRRVANRVAFASLSREERMAGDLGDFHRTIYALYGPEDSLPECERMRPGNPANNFDPMGFLALYEDHPYEEQSIIYLRTEGESAVWLDQLVKVRKVWGTWALHFIYKSLICGESNEVYDAIADDQGDFVAVEDDARFCLWLPEWRGWAAWASSVTDDEITTLAKVFAWLLARARGESQTHERFPDPGTPEAAALLSKLRKEAPTDPKREIKK
jgi:hypothetical protein